MQIFFRSKYVYYLVGLFTGYRLCRRPLLYDLQDVPTALTITSTLWDCHFQHLSLVLPPSLSLSLPVSLSLSSRLLMRVRVCRPVCTFARASACMCARASASTRGCGCFPAVWGRLRPSPAVSGRLQPSPALRERAALPPQTPPTLEKDPLTGTVTSIRFSHRHCHLQSLPLPLASFLICVSWHCHFQHLSLSLPPSLPHSLSLPLPSRLLVCARMRVCRRVFTFARSFACMCARASACTRGCGCFPAVSGRLQPSPAVSSRLQP